ncbi:MAG: hypothetical protein ACI9KE_002716 [Polyangiales bacterium]|jgi:hypothetical protein
MRNLLSLLLLPALMFVGPTPASARCAPSGLQPYLMNGVDHPLAADGALLVGLRSSRSRAGGRGVDFPELTLNQGDTSIPLRLELLSSFVARYVPESTPAPGRYRVAGLEVHVRFEARTSEAALAAPAVRAVQRREERRRRGVREQVRVVFRTPPPSRAIAALVDSERGGFGGGVISADRGGLSVYDWGGGCQRRPRDLRSPPASGSNVIVRLVDRDGQLGAPVTVPMT